MFKEGDRVIFKEFYGSAEKGDIGTVIKVMLPGVNSVEILVEVRSDSIYNKTYTCYPRRLALYEHQKPSTSTLLPGIIYQMCVNGALIVGSRAKVMCGDTSITPDDYDLLVPYEKWPIISLLLPSYCKPNKFGGWRFKLHNNIEVDVWPGSLEHYLSTCKTRHGGSVCAVDYINNRSYQSTIINVD